MMTLNMQLSEGQIRFLRAMYGSSAEKGQQVCRNFEVLKQDLAVGTPIKAWTAMGRSVHGGSFYGWLEGVITKRDLRNGKHLYYEIDGKRWIPARDITDAEGL